MTKESKPEKLPLSAFIITLNEADRLEACLLSLRELADEIIVVDSGSTDGTVQLAEALGCRVIHNDWPGYGPQKYFAESQCRHDWLLNLDADERVTPALAAEIRTIFASGAPEAPGYIIQIRDLLPHETRPAKWAFSYDPVRLYDRRKGRYAQELVHDRVHFTEGGEYPPNLGRLTAPILHYSNRNLADAVFKLNRYSDMQVQDMLQKGRAPHPWRLWLEFPLAFCKAYFLRRYCLYGRMGYAMAITHAYGRFLRLAKRYEADLPNYATDGKGQ